jgi:hypothetical protein
MSNSITQTICNVTTSANKPFLHGNVRKKFPQQFFYINPKYIQKEEANLKKTKCKHAQ